MVCVAFAAMQAMDLYDVSEGYPSTVEALKRIKCPVLVTMAMGSVHIHSPNKVQEIFC